MAREVERRWLVTAQSVPVPKPWERREIMQVYTMINDADGRERRIRRQLKDGQLTHEWTEKLGSGIDRDEVTTPATAAEFNAALAGVKIGQPITKDVYLHPTVDGPTIEVHVFHGDLAAHTHIEVEFTDVKSAKAFVVPDWFGREVTEDVRYNGRNLCRFGIPPEEA